MIKNSILIIFVFIVNSSCSHFVYDENYLDTVNYDNISNEYELYFEDFNSDFEQMSYNIVLRSSSELINDIVPYFDDEYLFEFEVIQVSDMEDIELEEKINNSIIEAMKWMVEVLYYKNIPWESIIYMQSHRYLSFGHSIQLYHHKNMRHFLHYFVTVDIQTGERVMLNDLIHVNLEFAEFVEHTEHWQSQWDREFGFVARHSMIEWLELASLSPRGLYELSIHSESKINETLGPIMFRSSFYLKENQLVIVPVDDLLRMDLTSDININLEDIKDFLKVPAW